MTFLHIEVDIQNTDNRLCHLHTDTQRKVSHKGNYTLWSNAPSIQFYSLQAQNSCWLFHQKTIGLYDSILFSLAIITINHTSSKHFSTDLVCLGKKLDDNLCMYLHQVKKAPYRAMTIQPIKKKRSNAYKINKVKKWFSLVQTKASTLLPKMPASAFSYCT